MTDLLEQAAAWLDDMRVKHMSQTVTYTRSAESVEMAATFGRTTYEVTDESGATVQAVATDFVVSAEAIVLGGERTLPDPGDQIRVSAGGQTRVFEVMDLGGAGHYRPADPYGRMLRIHTKHVDTQ